MEETGGKSGLLCHGRCGSNAVGSDMEGYGVDSFDSSVGPYDSYAVWYGVKRSDLFIERLTRGYGLGAWG